MKAKKYKGVKQILTSLKDVKPGTVFHFRDVTFTEALKEELFFMKLNCPECKGDRVRMVSTHTGDVMERDSIHLVVVVGSQTNVWEV